jgi:outer membrane protein OmpA-like peptidoglycan-associated protein
MRIFTFLILSVLFAPNFGQNLVLNPSLEEFTKEGYPAFWTKINLTPDIYAANRELSDEGGKKHAYKDVFTSRKFGTTCFGLLFSHFFTEVIQAKLASPLEEGKTYKVTLHTICPKNYIGKPIWEVSVNFSQKSLPRLGASTYAIPYTSLHQADYQYINNKEEWVEVSGYYKAEGGEKYISIGNFTGANKDVLNEQQAEVIYSENFPVQMRGMYMYIFDNLEVVQENVPDYLAEYRNVSENIPQQGPDSPPKPAPKPKPQPTKTASVAKTPTAPKVKETLPSPLPAPDPLAPYLANVVVSNIHTLYFDKGRCELWETSFHALDSLADLMKQYPHLALQLSGHTSDEGNAKELTFLSQKRVNAARDYLISAGVPSRRIVCKVMGSSVNVNKNESYESRLKNQRVEMEFMDMGN